MEVLLLALVILVSLLIGAAIAYYVMLRARGEATPTHTPTPIPVTQKRIQISLMGEGGHALPIVFDTASSTGVGGPGTVLGSEGNNALTSAEGDSSPHLILEYGERPITLGGGSSLIPQNMGMRTQMSRIMAEVGIDERGPFINLDKGFSREGAVITVPRLQGSGRIPLAAPVQLHWRIKVEEGEKSAKKKAETFALPAAPSGMKGVKPLGMMAPPKTVSSKAFWLIEVVD